MDLWIMHLFECVCVCVRNCEGVHTPDLLVLVREPDQGSNLLNWLKKKEHNTKYQQS